MPRRRAGRLVSALRLRRGTHATPWSSLCARAVGLAPHDLEVTVRRRGPRSLVEHRHQRGGGRAGRLHRAKTAAAEELPDAVTVMDPFHVVRVPGDAPDTDLDGHDRVKSARCPALLVTCDDQPGRVAEQSSAQPSGHQPQHVLLPGQRLQPHRVRQEPPRTQSRAPAAACRHRAVSAKSCQSLHELLRIGRGHHEAGPPTP